MPRKGCNGKEDDDDDDNDDDADDYYYYDDDGYDTNDNWCIQTWSKLILRIDDCKQWLNQTVGNTLLDSVDSCHTSIVRWNENKCLKKT